MMELTVISCVVYKPSLIVVVGETIYRQRQRQLPPFTILKVRLGAHCELSKQGKLRCLPCICLVLLSSWSDWSGLLCGTHLRDG